MRARPAALLGAAALVVLAGCSAGTTPVGAGGGASAAGSLAGEEDPATSAPARGSTSPAPPEPTTAKGTPLTSWIGTYEFTLPASSPAPSGTAATQRPVYTLKLEAQDGRSLAGRLIGSDGGAGTPVSASGTDKLAITVPAGTPDTPVGLQDGRPLAFLDGDPQAPETCLGTLTTAAPDVPTCGRYFTRVVD